MNLFEIQSRGMVIDIIKERTECWLGTFPSKLSCDWPIEDQELAAKVFSSPEITYSIIMDPKEHIFVHETAFDANLTPKIRKKLSKDIVIPKTIGGHFPIFRLDGTNVIFVALRSRLDSLLQILNTK